ncbi:MAG: dockerin type I domain-containing protein [Planctomycetota bacterium]|nr:dockerin type I domain-containing protein [Planctomycetota bacterium]
MKRAHAVLLAAAAFAAPVFGFDFRLVNTNDVDDLVNPATPAFYIGNNPSTIALDGDILYVGGFNNSGAPANQRIVKIIDVFNTRGRVVVPTSETLMPFNRGFTGMDIAGDRLLVNYDSGSRNTPNSLRLYNTAVPALNSPNLITASGVPSGEAPRGIAGPAFDFGFDGTGFNVGGTNQPLPAVLDFTTRPEGPVGLFPATLDTSLGATFYEPDAGGPNVRDFNAPFSLASTLWRDLDIHPTTGMIVGRAGNNVVIAKRAGSNATLQSVVQINNGTITGVLGQNVQIVNGTPDGDFIIYNDRRITGAQPFASVIKTIDDNGAAVTVNFFDVDGTTPYVFPDGVGLYDFSWDGDNQRLAIVDFATRRYWIFETVQPCGAADINSDGQVDFFDYLDFANAFGSECTGPGQPLPECQFSADFNNDGQVDFFDYLDFAAEFGRCS